MILLPQHLYDQYQVFCIKSDVNDNERADYGKWLRYFLDYCEKYHVTGDDTERIQMFLRKLHEKRQSEERCRQAQSAVTLYFEMLKGGGVRQVHSAASSESEHRDTPYEKSEGPASAGYTVRKSVYSVAGYEEKSDSPEWDAVIAKLADEIKVRHYSRKTLQTYAHWSRQFQRFLKNKPPEELSVADIKEYLTYLAVKCKVAASTQNQAFNSLLFLYRHALKIDFGRHTDTGRL